MVSLKPMMAASPLAPRMVSVMTIPDFCTAGRSGATRELVTFWDTGTGSEVLTLRGRSRSGIDPPFNPRVVFGPGGAQVATSQWDFTVDVWTAAGYGESK